MVGKILGSTLTVILLISFSGCTLTPEEEAAFRLKQQQKAQRKAQCKINMQNCMEKEMYRGMSSDEVVSYCLRAVPCYRSMR